MSDDPYQSLDRIRARIDHTPEELFDDNAEKRFDRLIMGTTEVGDTSDGDAGEWFGLEYETRSMIESILGDQPLGYEGDRTDEIRPGRDAALTLVYPIQDVTEVEIKRSLQSDWETLDADKYTWTDHRLILEYRRPGTRENRGGLRRNVLADTAGRATWRDIASKLRVTYDRGFEQIPGNILSIQTDLINRMIRLMRAEQNFAAASPDEWQGVSPEFDRVMTEDIRERIYDVTSLGGVTQSV